MNFNFKVCDSCSRREEHKADCPYKSMSLVQYLYYKNIGFAVCDDIVLIDTSNLMNSSAMIELNNEIARCGYDVLETGWDFKRVKSRF